MMMVRGRGYVEPDSQPLPVRKHSSRHLFLIISETYSNKQRYVQRKYERALRFLLASKSRQSSFTNLLDTQSFFWNVYGFG